VVVLVVGETARAANWGLSGYARPTTPELATLPVINFTGVTSCGTDTETSLPCMFSAVGRRQYDERRIHRSENLLHVAARAGVQVHWRDNQSGCKGVCDGFAQDTVAAVAPGLCADGHCLDEGLLRDLPALLRGPDSRAAPVRLVVLHQIGNHGPAYYRRVPESFRHFLPSCDSDDLRQCSIESIVNAYDNALRYTDHVLATLIHRLQAEEVDAAVLYVSDHGESLGEHGLFLHGVPYAIAPAVQRQVPMVMWVSPGFAAARGLDTGCLAARAASPGPTSTVPAAPGPAAAPAAPATHDHLFHTVLGLLDVHTSVRETSLDLTHGCTRTPAATLQGPHAG
jgi:lipid A ethanolaminephosphotransferase